MRGRLLTVRQLRLAMACNSGIEDFRSLWGEEVLVTDEWAAQAARHFGPSDCRWVSHTCRNFYPQCRPLLSQWGGQKLARFIDNYGMPYHGGNAEWSRASWAYFASIYVDDERISRM